MKFIQNTFRYTSHRKYLADDYQKKKETTRYFSYRYAQKNGVNSSSFLIGVTQGKRHFTSKMTDRSYNVSGIQKKERNFFHLFQIGFELIIIKDARVESKWW